MSAHLGRPRTDLRELLSQEHPQVDLQYDRHDQRVRQYSSLLAAYADTAVSHMVSKREEFKAERQRLADKIGRFEQGKKEAEAKELQLTEGKQSPLSLL
jgi:7-keto-8-aminopelargonate synthetase-like enzyme